MARERKRSGTTAPGKPDPAPPADYTPWGPDDPYCQSAQITIDGVDLAELLKSRRLLPLQAKPWLLVGDEHRKPGVVRWPQLPDESLRTWAGRIADKAVAFGEVPAG